MTNPKSQHPFLHGSRRSSPNYMDIYRSKLDNEQISQLPMTYLQQQNERSVVTDERLKFSDMILSNVLTSSSSDRISSQSAFHTFINPSHSSIMSKAINSTQSRKRKQPNNDSLFFLTHSPPTKRSISRAKFFSNSPPLTGSIVMPVNNSKLIQTDLTLTSSKQYFNEEEELKMQINELCRTKVDIQQQYQTTMETIQRCLAMTRSLLIEKSQLEKKQAREKAMKNRFRLGQFVTQRQGISFVEQWIDGYEFPEKQRAKEQLIRTKENLDKERKLLAKKKSLIIDETQDSLIDIHSSSSSSSSSSNSFSPNMSFKDWCEYDEVLRLRQLTLKREEYELSQDLEKLDRERNVHIRELKRLYNEDQSRFNQNNILHQRSLLLTLIGKGGFSEVHRAYDLEEQRYVACKIHQLNKEWKEEKKANFMKHALREYNIHKHLEHKRIVKLYDVFEIDTNSFCTVLEYCHGNDLDFFLKQNQMIPEKEARLIMMQIVNALKYLNTQIKPPVIHYDLKPGNVLLGTGNDCGEIKITDFGLSKQMHEDTFDEDGMDLSSQGAGTYWYLPPEVFVQGINPPKISSKVDVWSVGCIFYQCLYGRKPYGHNLSQAAVLENQIILNAKEIQFPSRPQVSNEAKIFIRRCLTYQVRDRPDVLQLSEDEYFTTFSKRTTSTSSSTLFCPKFNF